MTSIQLSDATFQSVEDWGLTSPIVVPSIPSTNGEPRARLEVLVVEDNQTYARLLEFWLQTGVPEVSSIRLVETLAAALEVLSENEISVVILDLNLPDCEGLSTFRAIHREAPKVPIVIVSGEFDESTAVSAMREGAQDYIVKGSQKGNPLTRAIRFSLERIKRENAEASLRCASQKLAVAQLVQEHFYPKIAPQLPGLDVAGIAIAGDGIAGDYFDYLPMKRGMGIVVGDVMGHGYDAALVMAGVRGALRAIAEIYDDIGELMAHAQRVLAPDLSERFVTMLFTVIDPVARTLHYGSAGHAALLLDGGGNVKEWLVATAMPLGVGEERVRMSPAIPLVEGDLLLLYTDGITESCSPQGTVFGVEGMLEVVRACRDLSAGEIAANILREVQQFTQKPHQDDDMTAVVAKILPTR
jgi:sigma-B regulation protein RsbU (phosphoserine phosphatase)